MDEYDRGARIYPALLAVLPISITFLILGVTSATWWTGLSGLVLASGLWGLVAQMGRYPGKKMEPSLWKSWGGPPTTVLLRHREGNRVRVARLHERLAAITQLTFPSAEDEQRDPDGADETYEAAAAELREATRDQTRFPLVFKENCNYGYRRNVLGLKPWAIGSCVLAACLTAVVLIFDQPDFLKVDDGLGVTLILMDLIGALAWSKLVTPEWVRQPAFAYAERLLESSRDLV